MQVKSTNLIPSLCNNVSTHILSYVKGDYSQVCRFVCQSWNLFFSSRISSTYDTATTMIQYSNRDEMKWAVSRHFPSVYLCGCAARNGCFVLLRWMRSENFRWNVWTCDQAAAGGHLEILKWARENHCPWTEWTCTVAMRNGHVNIVKWCIENECPWKKGDLSDGAILSGSIEALEWVRDRGIPMRQLFSRLAGYGHLKALKWALKECHKNKEEPYWGPWTLGMAIANGNYKVVDWLLKNGCPKDTSVCGSAITVGRLDLLKLVRSYGCPFGESPCAESVLSGSDLEMIQWLHEQGCECDIMTFKYAGVMGRMDVLKWLLEIEDSFQFDDNDLRGFKDDAKDLIQRNLLYCSPFKKRRYS